MRSDSGRLDAHATTATVRVYAADQVARWAGCLSASLDGAGDRRIRFGTPAIAGSMVRNATSLEPIFDILVVHQSPSVAGGAGGDADRIGRYCRT